MIMVKLEDLLYLITSGSVIIMDGVIRLCSVNAAIPASDVLSKETLNKEVKEIRADGSDIKIWIDR